MENIWDCQDNGECDMQSIKSEENDCWVLVYMQNHKPLNTHTHTHNLGMGANISDDEENVKLASDKVY